MFESKARRWRADVNAEDRPFGPDELTERLIEQLAKTPKAVKGGITETAIRRLVRIAYEASLLPEEGRFPSFRLLMGGFGLGEKLSLGASTGGILIDDVDAMRRFVPTLVGPRTAAILCVDGDGRLRITDTVDFEQHSTNPIGSIHRLSDQPMLVDGMLYLRVDGPGNLRTRLHPGDSFHLRGGEVRKLYSYFPLVEPFTNLLVSLCEPLHKSLVELPKTKEHAKHPNVLVETLAELWAYTLSTAVTGHHGGAFAIVNPEGRKLLSMKYEADLDLLATLGKPLRDGLISFEGKPHYEFKDYWRSRQSHLRALWRTVGNLSFVDGCVVLNRELIVQGFGAKIEAPSRKSLRPLVDGLTDEEIDESVISEGMGTRHRSACRLAQSTPGIFVFVVSQDGDLTVFHGEESRAVCYKSLDASPSAMELL